MKKKLIARILQAPVLILFTFAVLGSFYIKIVSPSSFPTPISWATPITLLIFLVIYFLGRKMETKSRDGFDF